ncbi:MAG: inositol monophosphatase [Cyclobacteriaceae bacterium]|jgi:myo-inositol-1(or 4)-monophosphatase|nr:inositol monophosphatase [Cyclobacteriaceae bacterium]MDH4296287.1 inositol monophosphatase [Cyclobacteriaceae bacterium]MDH5248653.1 inositol monophosphatase [Cyclobacteriaceae bacterium]
MNLKDIERNVIGVCQEVGEFIYTEGSNFDLTRIEQKDGFANLVSYVDKEAERRLVKAFHEIFPEAGFITEEGTVEQSKSNEYNWIIDPLDGTTNFLHGLPIYAISVALTQRDKPILGVVYHIVRKECFHAIEDGNAYCNDKIIHVSAVPTLQESLLATGFPYYHFDKRDKYLDIIKEFLEHSHGIRRLGSAAIDLAYVACGRIEGYFEYNLNAWDVAGGVIIVRQAGGIVTDFKGGDDFLFGGELCAANKNVHPEMLDLVKRKWN